jgi:hypothetical protein
MAKQQGDLILLIVINAEANVRGVMDFFEKPKGRLRMKHGGIEKRT